MTAERKLVLLAVAFFTGCVARPERITRRPPHEIQERLQETARSLPANTMLRMLLEAGRYGDGIHQPWMDDMRQSGIKMARVEVHFTWFFGPRLMKPTRVMYFTDLETTGHQITDAGRLEKLRGSRLESDLKAEGIRLAPAAHWLDLPESIFRPFPGQTTVTLFDNEWLPLPILMNTEIDPHRSPLIQAIFSGDEADIKELLASGKVAAQERDEGLFWACGPDEPGALELLLKSGANVNTRNGDSLDTPLIVAARWRNATSVEVLLKAGADPNLSNAKGDTPLLTALDSSDDATAVAQLLLSANAGVNATNADGVSPLMRAAQRQGGRVVKMLIQRGALVDAADRTGNTALIWAARFGNRQAVPTLLAAHADLDISNQAGQTALAVAVRESHPDIAELLQRAGASQ